MNIDLLLQERFSTLFPHLTERQKRLAAAADARSLGYGGISRVADATGLSRTTIHQGLRELAKETNLVPERSRRQGGGRKKVQERDPSILTDLEAMVHPSSRGDPMSPLRWTLKSTRQLAEALTKKGYQVTHPVVGEMLKQLGYSLQANMKTLEEGNQHPDRDAQFRYINEQVTRCLKATHPVISVDTKKKELIGRYRNNGKEYRPKGKPEKVKVHDFIDLQSGKAIPYGIYDVAKNLGWVNVGCDHDTAAFAVESIRRWWREMGSVIYPKAKKLLICADSGGSNGYRLKLWKVALQAFTDETGLEVTVCHLPPGTSKWNKIEHRLFSHISMNWRGRPLVSHDVVVELIGATTTKKGLRVKARLDRNPYPTKVVVSKQELAKVNLRPHQLHGEWNYTIWGESFWLDRKN
jgi:transposase